VTRSDRDGRTMRAPFRNNGDSGDRCGISFSARASSLNRYTYTHTHTHTYIHPRTQTPWGNGIVLKTDDRSRQRASLQRIGHPPPSHPPRPPSPPPPSVRKSRKMDATKRQTRLMYFLATDIQRGWKGRGHRRRRQAEKM